MDYSIIIPAYNEEQRISNTVGEVLAYFRNKRSAFEVIVVDDGSMDGTVDLACAAAAGDERVQILHLKTNRGKGAAVREGMLASKGSRVLLTDADLSTPLTELPRLEEALDQGFGIAIGSRGMQESSLVRRQPLGRELAGKAGNLFIRLLCPALWEYSDTQCGFKLFTGEIARRIFPLQLLERFGFDVEVLYLARRRGYTVAEVPVVWAHNTGSKVKPTDYMYTMFEVMRVRVNEMTGKYKD